MLQSTKMENYFEGKASVSNEMYNLSPNQAFAMCNEDAVIVDVREEYLNRYKIFYVPGLFFCPKSQLPHLLASLPAGKPLIVADASGIHSPGAVRWLMQHGFEGKCANLSGGLVAWEHSGLPVVIDINERASGPFVWQPKTEQKNK